MNFAAIYIGESEGVKLFFHANCDTPWCPGERERQTDICRSFAIDCKYVTEDDTFMLMRIHEASESYEFCITGGSTEIDEDADAITARICTAFTQAPDSCPVMYFQKHGGGWKMVPIVQSGIKRIARKVLSELSHK